MTIYSSLNAGVAGLNANASRLATIADNIANSGTAGYKRAVTEFHSMVTESGKATYSAGGVRATTGRMVDQDGALRTTTNATDLAVRGRGFLPVTTEAAVTQGSSDLPFRLTTTGSFRPDENGFLKTESGLVLMGWPASADGTVPNFPRGTADGLEPVQINVNKSVGEPTTAITLGVNLPATSTEYTTDPAIVEQLPVEYFDNLGRSQAITVSFTPVLPAAPGDPATNQWTMTMTDSDSASAVVGEYTLTFDDTRASGGTLATVSEATGGAYDPVTGKIVVNVAGGPIEIDLGASLSGNGLTQFSESFSPNLIAKDGSPVGNMTSYEVDSSGYVRASFDSGITRIVYQIPLVDMANPNGLQSEESQTYSMTNDSGSFFLWDAGDGATGEVIGYALEESTTDVAGELTALIQTQRAYSSNAKVIQTVDEMLQETTNIKR